MLLTVVFYVVLNCTNINSCAINTITLGTKFEVNILSSISKLQILLLPHGGASIAGKTKADDSSELYPSHTKKASLMISSPKDDHLPLYVPLALLRGFFSHEPQMAVNFKR